MDRRHVRARLRVALLADVDCPGPELHIAISIQMTNDQAPMTKQVQITNERKATTYLHTLVIGIWSLVILPPAPAAGLRSGPRCSRCRRRGGSCCRGCRSGGGLRPAFRNSS